MTITLDSTAASFVALPDLASRRLGGSVVAANDESFAERENLIKAAEPAFSAYTFGHKGQVMDGWESRRRREPGHDWAIVRLGIPGLVRGLIVDTAFFTGNYPPEVSVEGAAVEGYPSPTELAAAQWQPLVSRRTAVGDTRNSYPVADSTWVTHVRLCQYPDGGVARLRVHGEPVPDPRFLAAGPLDLAALENAGRITACSNMHYSSPTNLISPGLARVMGEGWETSRRRDDSNDWVQIALAGPGRLRFVELDTSCFVHNAPGTGAVSGRRGDSQDWVELLPRQRLQPDTRHRFRLDASPEVSEVRVDIYPDGGMARVRLWGELSAEGREALALRWYDTLPTSYTRALLVAEAGMSAAAAEAATADRPFGSADRLPPPLAQRLGLTATSNQES